MPPYSLRRFACKTLMPLNINLTPLCEPKKASNASLQLRFLCPFAPYAALHAKAKKASNASIISTYQVPVVIFETPPEFLP